MEVTKKKYYLTLDTETATLPFANQICKTAKQKQNVAIAKPLIYDIGWVITDRQGNIVKQENYLIQETFFVPSVFNTAYYREKRPIYMELLSQGLIKTANWEQVANLLLYDLRAVDISTAYNACFDFKKAIPFTEEYIKHLYDSDYNDWERKQYGQCRGIAEGDKKEGTRPDFLKPEFEFRGEKFPVADLWNVACTKLINIDKYRDYCLKNRLLTASAQYFKSSAETTFQYLMKQHDFVEDHTALSDALIEAQVLTKALKRGAVPPQIEAFPFRNLGTTVDYVRKKRPKYVDNLLDAFYQYTMEAGGGQTAYWKRIDKVISQLEELRDEMIKK